MPWSMHRGLRNGSLRIGSLALWLSSCAPFPDQDGRSREGCVGVAPTAFEVHAKILAPSCGVSGACHNRAGRKAGLDFSSVQAACDGLLNKPSCEFPSRIRSIPGKPDESLLLAKLSCKSFDCGSELGDAAPSCAVNGNKRMPSDSAPLPACQIDGLRLWIAEGMPGCVPN